ncbi:TonB-dependent receptor [Stenotrophobium rhamnosiphilum]|nr:TonB-dependent receptor [Stenotrophobium rhamnosiphilum]
MPMLTSRKKAVGKAALAAACVVATCASSVTWAQEQSTAAEPAPPQAASQPSEGSSVDNADLFNELLSDPTPPPAQQSSTETPAPQPETEAAAPAVPAENAAEPVATIPVAEVNKKDSVALKGAADSRRIEEIVVTATKRAESIREIPQSITAISGASLENTGKLNLIDFIQETPGVTATQGSAGYTRFTMRGISTDTGPTSPSSSPVGIFVGDTAFTDPYIANIVPDLSAFDLSGVQVLKGPQGTLFGGAALSGAIRYELQEPVQGEWQVRAFSQFISPDEGTSAFTNGVAVNVPLLKDNNLAFRFAYVKRNYPGITDDGRTGENDVDHGSGDQYRAILLWEPENWKLKLTHLSQDFYAPNAVSAAASPDGPREQSFNIFKVPAKNDFGMDSLEVAYNFDSMRLVSLSSYLYKNSMFTIDGTPVIIGIPPMGYPQELGLLSPVTENSKAYSQELRLQSTGSDPFQWLVGGYFYSYKMYFNILIDTPLHQGATGPGSLLYQLATQLGIPTPLLNGNTQFFNGTSNVKSTEKAGFFDLSYELWDSLKLTVGARFYSTEVKGGFVASGILILAENNLMEADTRNQITERGINPKFTATYHFTDDISLYTQAAKGFRFGGIQYVPSTPTNGVPPTFKSDSIWNYELGLRTGWFDDSLHADITAFYIKYKNPIITQATPGIAINYNDNVSGAVSRGLEASLLWNTPINGLSASLQGSLVDAHITTPFTASGGKQIPVGQEMPGTAPTQYNATVSYVRPVGAFSIGGNVGYNYIGQGYGDIQHTIKINGYGTLNAGLVFNSDELAFHPKLAINISNLLNTTAVTYGGTVAPIVPINGYSAYALNPPRTISLRLSIDL